MFPPLWFLIVASIIVLLAIYKAIYYRTTLVQLADGRFAILSQRRFGQDQQPLNETTTSSTVVNTV